ncbi:MAG: zinc-binding dehydrogenase [Candidatus Saccharimonadales bacterium]
MLAKKLGVTYSFHFMYPSGAELTQLKKLYETEAIRPVLDKVFPLNSTKEALSYYESGKAKGKIVIRI